jgi:hypothetical protein
MFYAAVRYANRRTRKAQKGIVEWKGGTEKNAVTVHPAQGVGVCPRREPDAETTRFPPDSPCLATPEPGQNR